MRERVPLAGDLREEVIQNVIKAGEPGLRLMKNPVPDRSPARGQWRADRIELGVEREHGPAPDMTDRGQDARLRLQVQQASRVGVPEYTPAASPPVRRRRQIFIPGKFRGWILHVTLLA